MSVYWPISAADVDQTHSLLWKDFFFIALGHFRLIVAEHEHIPAGRMPVEITVEEDVTTLQCPFHHHLDMVVYGVELARRSNPLSVQILAHERASIVTNYDAVRVQHRHYLEYEGVS